MKRFEFVTMVDILESIQRAGGHHLTFSQLAFSTPRLRNRASMLTYLDLLQKLGWLRREKYVVRPPAGFERRVRRGRPSTFYVLTQNGEEFLKLLPP